MDVFAGLDVGYKDPTAMCVIAYDWDSEQYYLVDEYFDAERTTEQHAIEIRRMVDKYSIDYIKEDGSIGSYHPDFYLTLNNGDRWVVETKGAEELNAQRKIDRLKVWCDYGEKAEFGKYSIMGAQQGRDFGTHYRNNTQALHLINDYVWLKEQFNAATE